MMKSRMFLVLFLAMGCLVLPVRAMAEGEPKALSEAIVRQAFLGDTLAQAKRAAFYAQRAGADKGSFAGLARVQSQVMSLAVKLGAGSSPANLRQLDPERIRRQQERLSGQIEEILERAKQYLARRFDWFRPWNPVEGEDAYFTICPVVSRADVIYKPFRFRVVATPIISLSSINPARGKYDFAPVKRMVAANAGLGAKTIIRLGFDVRGWWLEKKPGGAVFAYKPTGRGEKSVRAINIWSKELRLSLKDLVKRLGQCFAGDENVAGYQFCIDSFLPVSKVEMTGGASYNPEVIRAWREYLKARYKSVSELNALWRTDYADFDEVAPPSSLVPTHGQLRIGLLREFENFRLESQTGLFREILQALRAADEGHAILPAFRGIFHNGFAAVDHYALAGLDWDFYAVGRCGGVPLAYGYSVARFNGKGLWDASCGYETASNERALAARLTSGLWREAAWGRRGFIISPAGGALAKARYSLGALTVLQAKLRGLGELMGNSDLLHDGIAILQPSSSCEVACPAAICENEAKRLYSLIWTSGYTAVFLPEEVILTRPEELNSFSVIVAPYATHIPPELNDVLLEWVKAGGTLVCSGPFGLFDPYGNPDGRFIWRVFNIANLIPLTAGPDWAAELDAQFMGQVIASDENNRPTAVRTRFGKGLVYMTLSPLSYRSDLMSQILEGAIAQPVARGTLRSIDLISRRAKGGDVILFAINIDESRALEDRITVAGKFERVVDLTVEGGCPVPVEVSGGKTVIPVRIEPGGCVVLRLEGERKPRRKSEVPVIDLLSPLIDLGAELLQPKGE